MAADNERQAAVESTTTRLTRRLGAPGAQAPPQAHPSPAVAPAAAAGTAAGPAPSLPSTKRRAGGDRGSIYFGPDDKALLMAMRDEIFHEARLGSGKMNVAMGALIRAVHRDFARIKLAALSELAERDR